jgi:hypothetical protein
MHALLDQVALVYPIPEQGIGRLASVLRPETQDAFEGCSTQQVWHGLALAREPSVDQVASKFCARTWTAVREHVANLMESSPTGRLVQTQLPPSPRVRSDEMRTEQWQEPLEIIGGEEVQGATQCPRANHGALVDQHLLHIRSRELPATHADCQGCGLRVLGLDTTHTLNNCPHIGNALS